MSKYSFLLAALASTLLSGCAIGTVKTAENTANAAQRDTVRYMDSARQPLAPEDTSQIHVKDDVWTSGTARRSDRGDPLPRQWEREGEFAIVNATPMPMTEIGAKITDITSIPVTFAPDVMDMPRAISIPTTTAPGTTTTMAGGSSGAPPDINAMLSSIGVNGSNGSAALLGGGGGNNSNISNGMIRPNIGNRSSMPLKYKGRLSGFLNEYAAYFGFSWEYTGGEIRIFRNITRTYTVHALPSTTKLASTLHADSTTSQSGASGGASGGSSQNVESDITIEIWKDLTNAVTSIVNGSGTVSSAVSTGTIMVSAPPQIVDRVQTYLDGQNARLSKQVTVTVHVLNVLLTKGDNVNLNIAGLFTEAAKYGLTFGNAAAAQTIGSTVASGIEGGLGLNVTSGHFSGTSVVAQALSSMGTVTEGNTVPITTMNGMATSLQIAHTQGYVAQVAVSNFSSATTAGATSQTTLTPGSVTTGFSISLVPRIDQDGKGLMMQLGMNISELAGANNGFDLFKATDGTEVELPNINSRNFVQQVYVPNNQTIVIAGFEQTMSSSSKTGVGDAGFLGLGGSQQGNTSRNLIVVLMTPTILSSHSQAVITTD
jgi:type IVB pilus formation R64 PilN family outer membrane protein